MARGLLVFIIYLGMFAGIEDPSRERPDRCPCSSASESVTLFPTVRISRADFKSGSTSLGEDFRITLDINNSRRPSFSRWD